MSLQPLVQFHSKLAGKITSGFSAFEVLKILIQCLRHFFFIENTSLLLAFSLCVFVMSFVYMKEELVSPSVLFFISAVVTSSCYCIWAMTCWDHRTKNGKK